jgi:mRNA interferase MazF
MRRGEIWTVAGGADDAGKTRPAVIVQSDDFSAINSVTICSFTTNDADASLVRPLVTPNERNGLRETCRLMADRLTTVKMSKLGMLIGRLDDDDMSSLNRAMVLFLGLTVSPRSAR